MRTAIYSDIHGNLAAYEAVLDDIKKQNIDLGVNLGDIVGYGPKPKECTDLAQSTGHITLLGNHDQAIVEQVDCLTKPIPERETLAYRFNHMARASARWSASVLTGSDAFLRTLPLKAFRQGLQFMHAAPYTYKDTQVIDENGFTLPDEFTTTMGPEWYYLSEPADAGYAYTLMPPAIVAFFGHSHVPFAHQEGDPFQSDLAVVGSREKKVLVPGKQALINVGSVGQPRDQNKHACYVIHDSETHTVEFQSVLYDLERTRKELIDIGTGWAEAVAARLLQGR
jgi:predicted phosphodiesterase